MTPVLISEQVNSHKCKGTRHEREHSVEIQKDHGPSKKFVVRLFENCAKRLIDFLSSSDSPDSSLEAISLSIMLRNLAALRLVTLCFTLVGAAVASSLVSLSSSCLPSSFKSERASSTNSRRFGSAGG